MPLTSLDDALLLIQEARQRPVPVGTKIDHRVTVRKLSVVKSHFHVPQRRSRYKRMTAQRDRTRRTR